MNESFETKLISSFKRHFILIVIISLLTGGGFYAYKSKTYVPMYSAKSTILVINKDKKGRNLNSLKKDKMLWDVYSGLVNTTSVINLVKQKTNISGYDYAGLKRNMVVEQKLQSIDVSVEDGNSDNAIKIVNAIVEAVDEQGRNIVGEDTVADVDKAESTENTNPPEFQKYFVVGLMGGLIVLTLLCYLFDSIKQTKRGEK